MPRDPSGNYSLYTPGNPVVTGTTIASAWANNTLSDLGSAMTDSLSRSGLGGMLAPFKLVDGSSSTPAFAFQSESNTGLYRPAPGEMDVVVGGTRLGRWTAATGYQGTFDNGVTWEYPLYAGVAGQAVTTGSIDFTAGTLLVGGVPIEATRTVSSSCGNFSTSSTGLVAVTNLSVTFTARGGPVLVQLIPDDSSNAASVSGNASGGWSAAVELALTTDNGSTFFARQTLGLNVIGVAGTPIVTVFTPVSDYSTNFAPSAGSVTLKCYARATVTQANVSYAKLCVTQF